MEGDMDAVMLPACHTLFKSVLGRDNWRRLLALRRHPPPGVGGTLPRVLEWLLDTADTELTNQYAAPAQTGSRGTGLSTNQRAALRTYRQLSSASTKHQPSIGLLYEGGGDDDVTLIEKGDTVDDNVAMKQKGFDDGEEYYVDNGGGYFPSIDDTGADDLAAAAAFEDRPVDDFLSHPSLNTAVVAVDDDIPAGDDNYIEIVCSNPQLASFQCGSCSVALGGVDIVQQHLGLQHSAKSLVMSCECGCAQRFSSIPAFVTYHASLIAATSGHVVCGYCARSFKRKKNLEEHVALKHNTSPVAVAARRREFRCDGCGKDFSYARSLYTHKKICKLPAAATPGHSGDVAGTGPT